MNRFLKNRALIGFAICFSIGGCASMIGEGASIGGGTASVGEAIGSTGGESPTAQKAPEVTTLTVRNVITFDRDVYASAATVFGRLERKDQGTRATMEDLTQPGLALLASKYRIPLQNEKYSHNMAERKIFLDASSSWMKVKADHPVIQQLGLQGSSDPMQVRATLKNSYARFNDRDPKRVTLQSNLELHIQRYDNGSNQWADIVPDQSRATRLSAALSSDLKDLYRGILETRYNLNILSAEAVGE